MAKKIVVEIPRSAVVELSRDTAFGSHLSNAILDVENTGEPTTVEIGWAKKRATVRIEE